MAHASHEPALPARRHLAGCLGATVGVGEAARHLRDASAQREVVIIDAPDWRGLDGVHADRLEIVR
ncbi:MAG: hypothetical protein M3N04_09135 [Actinomycetota bacterium]|nr:hypothetical protein [Actinomycetota bacterium]